MPTGHTAHYKERTSATGGEEPVYLLELSHPQLLVPARVVNDNQNLVSGGDTFFACAFRVQFPEDAAQLLPRVPIAIDNIGRELTYWLDASQGGRGATVRIMQVMRDTPDVIEQEYTLALLGARQGVLEITGELGYENILDQPALAALHTPESTPGIF